MTYFVLGIFWIEEITVRCYILVLECKDLGEAKDDLYREPVSQFDLQELKDSVIKGFGKAYHEIKFAGISLSGKWTKVG